MKINYAKPQRKIGILKSLIAPALTELETLLPSFTAAVEDTVVERLGLKRFVGGGCHDRFIQIEDKFLFISFFFRMRPTQAVEGYLFLIKQSQTNE